MSDRACEATITLRACTARGILECAHACSETHRDGWATIHKCACGFMWSDKRQIELAIVGDHYLQCRRGQKDE